MIFFWIMVGLTVLLYGGDIFHQWQDKSIGRLQKAFNLFLMLGCMVALWVGLFLIGLNVPDNVWWFKFW